MGTIVGELDSQKINVVDASLYGTKDSYCLDNIIVSCGGKHTLYNACQVLFQKEDELICFDSKLAYPIKDGIPVMLLEEARKLKDEELED